jgi:hypothetical protein
MLHCMMQPSCQLPECGIYDICRIFVREGFFLLAWSAPDVTLTGFSISQVSNSLYQSSTFGRTIFQALLQVCFGSTVSFLNPNGQGYPVLFGSFAVNHSIDLPSDRRQEKDSEVRHFGSGSENTERRTVRIWGRRERESEEPKRSFNSQLILGAS